MAKSPTKKSSTKKKAPASAAKPARPAASTSNKKKTPTRKPAPAAKQAPAKTSAKPATPKARNGVERPVRAKKVKSPLSAKELREYRNLLLLKRAEIIGDMSTMSEEALRNHDSANLSHMPLHMADIGTDNYDQELMLGLVESERQMVREINEALVRIQDKTYGVCEATGKFIGKARLAAKPWAKYCIEHARLLEANGGRR